MPIKQEKISITYSVGTTSIFNIPFTYIEESDIIVRIKEETDSPIETLHRGTDYEIDGKQLVLLKACKPQTSINIRRSTDIDQNAEFFNNSKIPAETLNFALDKLTMILQEHQEMLSSSVSFGEVVLPSDDEDEVSYEDIAGILKDIAELKNLINNVSVLPQQVTRAAVSAAQALESAIAAQNAKKAAEDIKNSIGDVSDLPTHNISLNAHADIRQLITNLNEKIVNFQDDYDTHKEIYDKHIIENNDAHKTFAEQITVLTQAVEELQPGATAAKQIYHGFGDNSNRQLCGRIADSVAEVVTQPTLQNVEKAVITADNGIIINKGEIWVSGSKSTYINGPTASNTIGFIPYEPFKGKSDFVDIACSAQTALALDRSGRLFSWGLGNRYCLGDGTTTDRAIPEEVIILNDNNERVEIERIEGGGNLFLASDGRNLYVCGRSTRYGLGQIDEVTASANFLKVYFDSSFSFEKITDFAVGGFVSTETTTGLGGSTTKTHYANTCLFIADGKLYGWGGNLNGELGIGTVTNQNRPMHIELSFTPVQVRCGRTHTVLLDTEGNVYISGEYINAKQKNAFFKVNFASDEGVNLDVGISQIAAGYYCTYMLNSAGIWGFGEKNLNALLGNATTANPVLLYSNADINKIYAYPTRRGAVFTTTPKEQEEAI